MAITAKAGKGEKGHTQLSRAEVVQFMDAAAGDDFQAQRDRLALGFFGVSIISMHTCTSWKYLLMVIATVVGKSS
jgi:hypothetical protein